MVEEHRFIDMIIRVIEPPLNFVLSVYKVSLLGALKIRLSRRIFLFETRHTSPGFSPPGD